MKAAITSFLLILFAVACTKPAATNKQIGEKYTIRATNFGLENNFLTIRTSLEKERTITIPKNGETDIPVLAAAGEYVTFSVPHKTLSEYRVLNAKGITIAHYESLPSPGEDPVVLDFIAFPNEDTEKNFIKYKEGIARIAGDQLPGKSYLLRERFLLENGIRKDHSFVQEPCTFQDEYQFLPVRGEQGNFNPQRFIFMTIINKTASTCSYGPGLLIPTNGISVINNSDKTVSFPIWDRLAVDGSPSNLIYRQLTIDSLSNTGVLTLHRQEGEHSKEVFVYAPK